MPVTLTETRIEIADRHTTLYYMQGKRPPARPIPFGSSEGYADFYREMMLTPSAEYSGLTGGRTGAILAKILPVYSGEKYWRRYLGREPFESLVWNEGLPFVATIKPRLQVTAPSGFEAKLSPVPRVFVYPFGWSTRISIRITGEHDIAGLAAVVAQLFNGDCFLLDTASQSLSLRMLFDQIALGVRTDAFGGADTRDLQASEIALVTTVLAKHGGSPSLGGLGVAEEEQLRYLVRPEHAPARRSFSDSVFRFYADDDLNYMIFDKLGRFIWMERLLRPEGRERQLLECYHHNSIGALLQAWHFAGLLTASAKERGRSYRLKDLVTTARDRLEYPSFRNASLTAFLQLDL